MDRQECMRRAAEFAVDTYIQNGMIVGLGTGSTASYAVRYLAKQLSAAKLRDVTAVATSVATFRLMSELGIPSLEFDDSVSIDVAIDGADAIDGDLNLIKGGGGALFREKLVELGAHKVIIIADGTKKAKGHLLQAFRVPVEIVQFGHVVTISRILSRVGSHVRSWTKRMNADGSLYLTDNNNVIMDIEFGPTDLPNLDFELRSVHGVVCTGLFLGIASTVVIAHSDGNLEVLSPDTASNS